MESFYGQNNPFVDYMTVVSFRGY